MDGDGTLGTSTFAPVGLKIEIHEIYEIEIHQNLRNPVSILIKLLGM